ncbi:hypothetical protein VNO80_14080 [Phaseolus coccineus]|uniref:NAC domain-containing protein n=1 Tax=Phaseolus coccineus TaxID=3886 RepID=A0AAN9N2P0_PHACN
MCDFEVVTLFCRSWLNDIGGFARKVKNTTLSAADQMKNCETYRECPKCHYHTNNSDISHEWPGFPVGVKFDPSDIELLKHLEAKCCVGNRKQHVFIHEFIPTLEGEQGICYTHPENLPGARKDGNSVHFFHKTANAYATGRRKRRKIQHQDGLTEEHVRWHKTGRTKSVIEDGVHKGFKKIMVLYIRSKEGSKPYKTNWVMHQFHLGSEEEEKDGEYVVSKVFYQHQKHTEKNEENTVVEDSNMAAQAGPSTPNPNPPTRPCTGKCDDHFDENELLSFIQDAKPIPGESLAPSSDGQHEDIKVDPAWLAGESQPDCDFHDLEEILLMSDSSALFNHSGLASTLNGTANNLVAPGNTNDYASSGVSLLDTLELESPPDFDLSNLQFGSQDSTLQWMDKL